MAGAVPCTYSDCHFFFASDKELRRHKDEQHEYCHQCDLDFENEDLLLIHKIQSNKHIVCAVCGAEFRSEGGRDSSQIHPAEQEIKCPCGQVFFRAFAFVGHIEKGECSCTSAERLVYERGKKLLINANRRERASFMSLENSGGSIDGDGDVHDGGVSLNRAVLDSKEAMKNQPTYADDDDNRSITSNTLSLKHWPTLGAQNQSEFSGPKSKDGGVDLKAFSRMSIENNKPIEKEEYPPSQISIQPPVSQSSRLSTYTSNNQVHGDDAIRFYRRYHPTWDPNKNLNSHTGMYECCDSEFKGTTQLAEHLLLHLAETFKCPGCGKEFKSNAALIAHCETSSRCEVLRNQQYIETLEIISGGFIKAAGFHDDGTLKLEAGDPETPQKKMVLDSREPTKW